MDLKNFLRDDLKDFLPYHSPVKPSRAKLDANESPFGLSDNVKRKLIDFIEKEAFNIYPDTDSLRLKSALSEFYSLDTDNIICGVGSDQIIDIITKVFLNENDKVAVINPSFSMYKITAKLNHGKIFEISYDENMRLSPERIISETNKSGAKILFLCTPNNPTGDCLDSADVVNIAKNTKAIVIADEAYGEFADTGSVIQNINAYKNIIVLKTFSKAYGIAGLRVGYALASKDIIDLLNIAKPPYNLSTFSEFVAAEVLKESEEYKNRIKLIKENREMLYNELSKIKYLKIYKSEANFIFADSEVEIVKFLEENGVLVRSFPPADNFKERIRISVGTKDDINLLLENLAKIEE